MFGNEAYSDFVTPSLRHFVTLLFSHPTLFTLIQYLPNMPT